MRTLGSWLLAPLSVSVFRAEELRMGSVYVWGSWLAPGRIRAITSHSSLRASLSLPEAGTWHCCWWPWPWPR